MKSTKAHFEKFKKYCLYYQKALGLGTWELRFLHEDLKDAYANTDPWKNNVAKIRLCKDLGSNDEVKDIDQFLKDTALHEVIHILTARLYLAGWQRFSREDEINAANEEVATTLTNLFKDKL